MDIDDIYLAGKNAAYDIAAKKLLALLYDIYKKKEIYAKRFPFVRFLRFAPSAASPLTMSELCAATSLGSEDSKGLA